MRQNMNTREEREDAYEKSKREAQEGLQRLLRRIVAATVAVMVMFWLVTSCSSISTGTVGVVSHFGAIEDYTLSEGVHFTRPWPFTSVTSVNVQTGATETEAAAASKDLQAVHTKVTLQWAISAPLAPRLVQRFGNYDGAWTGGIINPAIQEVVKAVSARYTAEQLITERSKVKAEIEVGLNEFIHKTLSERGCVGAIKIANVAVTNFDFSEEFNKSIEAKVKAQQDSLRAENEKTTRVTQAEATAKEKTLAADATAYQTEVESKARAAAIERESKALESSPNLIQLRIAERWDGKLPTYTGNSIPMLQLPTK
jgi:regulator of protease activity HflC (stomatin/prohibitin superfamily)